MVVYLDVLFAVNALMDGATLLAAARLGGVQVRKMRLIFSAALGGGYAVLGAVWPVLTLAPLRLLAGLGLCMVAFGRERHLARLCALYGVVAASFAGLAAALSAASGRRLLLRLTGSSYESVAAGTTLRCRYRCSCWRQLSATRQAGYSCAEMRSTARCTAKQKR